MENAIVGSCYNLNGDGCSAVGIVRSLGPFDGHFLSSGDRIPLALAHVVQYLSLMTSNGVEVQWSRLEGIGTSYYRISTVEVSLGKEKNKLGPTLSIGEPYRHSLSLCSAAGRGNLRATCIMDIVGTPAIGAGDASDDSPKKKLIFLQVQTPPSSAPEHQTVRLILSISSKRVFNPASHLLLARETY